jgi:hypothetical protein
MVRPQILCETAQTYEAANIERWLELHDTCPVTKKQLASKQMVPNYALKTCIEHWVEANGICLPSAPVYTPILPVPARAVQGGPARALQEGVVSRRSTGTNCPVPAPAAASPAGAAVGGAAAGDKHGSYSRITAKSSDTGLHPLYTDYLAPAAAESTSAEGAQGASPVVRINNFGRFARGAGRAPVGAAARVQLARGAGHGQQGPGRSSSSIVRCGRCTRTRWTIGIITLVVLAAVGAGVGIAMATMKKPKPEGKQRQLVFLTSQAMKRNLPVSCWLPFRKCRHFNLSFHGTSVERY